MYKRALLLSIRQLLQQKGYSLVHVLGIAVGFASCCIILLYVHHEYNYDRFFDRSDDIYKMVERYSSAQEDQVKATVPYPYARILEDQYPEVQVATAISGPYNNQNISIPVQNGKTRNFLEKAVYLADSNFLTVFNWNLLAGDRKTALVAPNSIVLTEATAQRYFGDIDPLGKTIKIGHRNSTVTAICETPPKHSHFTFNYLVSSSTVAWFSQDEFSLRTAHCYLKLRPDTKPASVVAKFPALVEQFFLPAIKKLQEVNGGYQSEEIPIPDYQLKSLHTLHLDPDQTGRMKPAGNRQLLHFLLLIAVFIFFMAGINYINLSTIQSTKRDKEIAVSKIIGANRGQILVQFLMRSTVLACLGIGLGLLIVQTALPYFNAFLDVKLKLPWSFFHLLIYILLILGIGLSAGLYPAIKLSSIAPITLYNPRISRSLSKLNGRDALMIFQFTVAILLLVGTFIIHEQRSLLARKDLGFDQEQVLVLEGSFARNPAEAQAFLQALEEVPAVSASSGSLWVQSFNSFIHGDQYKGVQYQEAITLHRITVGDGYTELLDIPIVQGRSFSALENDSMAVLLNEAAVQSLGLEDPIGQVLVRITEDGQEVFHIKGVIQDFHFESLDHQIKPLVVQSNEYYRGRMSYLLLKLATTASSQTLSQIEELWEHSLPEKPFVYRFLEENLQAQYEQEKRLGYVFGIYTLLSLFICAMGLFSLAAYHMRVRQKEVGIRKIVGASVASLLHLLSRKYIRLICWALLLALPISGRLAQFWLDAFATRLELHWSFFIIPALAILILCYSCIAYQIIRLAKKSPVEALSVND